jgi:hypothetical protein
VQLEALAAKEPDRIERRIALGQGYARAGRQDLAVVRPAGGIALDDVTRR